MPVLNINDVNLNYEVASEGSAVVFLHGYTGSSQDWSNQMSALSPIYKLIALDLRGHGKSSAPSPEEQYSMEIFVEDVHSLLNHLHIKKCCLVGHSLGGFLALEFALKYSGLLAGLVLVDTSSGDWEKPAGYAELRAKLEELARTQGMEAAFDYDAANNPVRIERFKTHPDLRETSRHKMLMTSVDGYIYTGRAMGQWKSVTGRLSEINVPTCIFWGEEDTPFLQASRILKERIPGAELITVKGSGHSPHEESPQAFNEKLGSFLGRALGEEGSIKDL
jgi:2-succinyl-6-hydroxy-2,4-cyclohexadiene-1-carboxylate synthase